MKILHLIDALNVGGAQMVLKNLFEAQPHQQNIHLYALRTDKKHIQIKHQNIYIISSKARYSFTPLSILRKFIDENEITVLHCHLFRSQVTGWLLKKLYYPEIQLVFHEHGPIFRNFAPWIIDQMLVALLKISRKDVFRYIAISEATKQRLIERAKLDTTKIIVVFNAVDVTRFTPNIPIQNPILIPKKNTMKYTIGYMGRLSTVKGCKYLIEAMKLLDIEDIELLIFGEGELEEELKTLIKKQHLENKVSFLGYVDTPEQAYTIFDVLVVPSLREAFGNIVIEAQACGTPVIATKTAGPSEIITHQKNGLLCEPENAQDIAENIKLLYHDTALQERIIQNGLQDINQYSLSNFTKKINQIYQSS